MTTVSPAATGLVRQLADVVSCRVIAPGDPDYDLLRHVWNADIDRYPAAIVRCETAQDVAAALRWCTAQPVPLTVRGGGHNVAGTAVADDAVLIDTALLDEVTFSDGGARVTVGAGCRWGDVDRAAADLGVAVPAGVVSHTGVAGLTLGGGSGYLARLYGATVDYVEEIEVVTAAGEIITASAASHPDLFWAMKGAGHNYGIATRFVFRTVPVPGLVTVRQAVYGAADRERLLRFFRDWGPAAPGNMGTYVRLLRAPEYWSQLPAAHRGQPVISVATIYYGDPAAEPAATAPMFAQAAPVYESLRTIPHVTLQHATDDEFRYGIAHYWKHTFFHELDDDVIKTILRFSDDYPGRSLNSSAFIAHQLLCPMEIIAGSLEPRDDSNDATAGVGAKFSANIGADWEYPGEKPPLVAWAKAFDAALEPYREGTYVNFTSVAGDEEAARAVYGDKYERLADVKRRYDPGNVFSRGLVDLS